MLFQQLKLLPMQPIKSGKGNTRALFSTVNNIFWLPVTLPPHLYTNPQCNIFITFFKAKIGNNLSQLTSSGNIVHSSLCPPFYVPPFRFFP